jgi:hypothetical protein
MAEQRIFTLENVTIYHQDALWFTMNGQLLMSLFLMAGMGCQGLRAMPENLQN